VFQSVNKASKGARRAARSFATAEAHGGWLRYRYWKRLPVHFLLISSVRRGGRLPLLRGGGRGLSLCAVESVTVYSLEDLAFTFRSGTIIHTCAQTLAGFFSRNLLSAPLLHNTSPVGAHKDFGAKCGAKRRSRP
jgi:hypothetical protein